VLESNQRVVEKRGKGGRKKGRRLKYGLHRERGRERHCKTTTTSMVAEGRGGALDPKVVGGRKGDGGKEKGSTRCPCGREGRKKGKEKRKRPVVYSVLGGGGKKRGKKRAP